MTQDDDTPDEREGAAAFDRDAAIQQLHQTEAALREIVRRKRQAAQARACAERAGSQREFAVNSLLAIEDELFTLFDSGETPAEILAYLKRSMPSVPVADLRHALKVARARRQRADLKMSPANPAPGKVTPQASGSAPASRPAATQAPAAKRPAAAPPTSGAAQPAATNSASPAGSAIAALGLTLPPWADGSDKLPTESDEDYVLRKNLETPPDHRRKFIGEHNS